MSRRQKSSPEPNPKSHIPAFVWMWLGCMNALLEEPGRITQRFEFRDELEKIHPEPSFLDGIVKLRDALPGLGASVRIAFAVAWRLEWEHRVQSLVKPHKHGVRAEYDLRKNARFVNEWHRASTRQPLPQVPLESLHVLAKAMDANPCFWFKKEALCAVESLFSQLHEPLEKWDVLDTTLAAVKAHLYPEKPVDPRYIAAWRSRSPEIFESLSFMEATRQSATLETGLPGPDEGLPRPRF